MVVDSTIYIEIHYFKAAYPRKKTMWIDEEDIAKCQSQDGRRTKKELNVMKTTNILKMKVAFRCR